MNPKLQKKTKMCVHNYTIFDLTSKDVTCYLWHESNGRLHTNIFASMLVDYLEIRLEQSTNIKRVT